MYDILTSNPQCAISNHTMGSENKPLRSSRLDLWRSSIKRHAIVYGTAAAGAVASLGIAVGGYGASGTGELSQVPSSPTLVDIATSTPTPTPEPTDYEHPFSIFEKTNHGSIDPKGCYKLSDAYRLPPEEQGSFRLDIGEVTATKTQLDSFIQFHPNWEPTVYQDGFFTINTPTISVTQAHLTVYGPGPGSLNIDKGGLVTAGGQSYLDVDNDVTRWELNGLIRCEETLKPNVLTPITPAISN